jgi:hypothetical protein
MVSEQYAAYHDAECIIKQANTPILLPTRRTVCLIAMPKIQRSPLPTLDILPADYNGFWIE